MLNGFTSARTDSQPGIAGTALDDAVHWLNLDPDLQFDDPRLADLLRYWDEKRGDRPMPARRDIDPIELRSHLGRLSLVDLEYDPFRLRYRLIGTNITETLGRDMTGRYFDEIYPPNILSDTLAAYGWMTENKKPLRGFGNALCAEKSMFEFEILNLPLSEDGTRVNMVLGEIIFSLRGAR